MSRSLAWRVALGVGLSAMSLADLVESFSDRRTADIVLGACVVAVGCLALRCVVE